MGLPLVATSDAHYVNREDADAQDVLLCINTGKFRTDTNRMRMEGDQFYLRSPEEMYAAFPGHEEAAAAEPGDRRQRSTSSWTSASGTSPRFTPPREQDAERLPARAVPGRACSERYADKPERCADGELSPDVLDRLDHELDVINQLGFANYFLIVWDFVRFARERDIPCHGPRLGRGLAGVATRLQLSHVCPLEYDLLFERFLDASRLEAPDIDIDFCKDRRGEVIEYVKEKYGEANVAQIGTFGTLAARAAIRDVGRALGMPDPARRSDRGDGARRAGHHARRRRSKQSDELQEDLRHRRRGPRADRPGPQDRRPGPQRRHARGGVVIADRPLVEYVPLQTREGQGRKSSPSGRWATSRRPAC